MNRRTCLGIDMDPLTREVSIMRCLLACLLVVGVLCPVLGCGGTLTQEDMRRHAIRRKRDKEEVAVPDTQTPSRRDAVAQALDGDAVTRQPPPKVGRNTAREPTSQQSTAAPIQRTTSARVAGSSANDLSGPAPAPAAGPGAEQVSAAVKPPPQPPPVLSPLERRQRTLDNLARIGQAVRSYTQTRKQVFAPASYDAVGRPLLSWRVELLPYLGYEELYHEFALDQPWDSPRNKALLASIPEVYQSPERGDETTNYQVLRASFTPFGGRPPGISLGSVEDGPADTVAILEVDDAGAVPWTKPADLEGALGEVRKQIGTLREDGIFVVWLDGSVGRILSSCNEADLRAVFSHDAGDSYAAYAVRAEATANPAPVEPHTTTDAESTVGSGNHQVAAAASTTPTRQGPPPQQQLPLAHSSTDVPAARVRLPIPDPLSMEQARKLVRALYQEEYASQKDARQQLALAQRMLKQAEEVSDDPAGQYVLLDTVLKIATHLGDATIAISALDQLIEHYTVDALTLTHDTLVALAKKTPDRAGTSQLLTKARGLIDHAIREEQFETAESLCQIATRAARQLGDRDAVGQLVQQAAFVSDCERAFKDVRRALTAATDTDDPEANLRVGRYYCFVQGQWEKGLPLLARGSNTGSNTQLQQLAEADLRQPTIPADQLKLADGWWDLAADDPAYEAALCGRAAYWYERALPELPNGLWRAKAEMRIREHRRSTGTGTASGTQ